MGTLIAAGGGEGERKPRSKSEPSSSSAVFVQDVVQDARDDSCSICLEPFCHSDPATVTSCKHEYHVQCILEWAQRSKECPMCWQPLSFKDPSSQELLDAVEHEHSWGNFEDGTPVHEISGYTTYAEFEERIMQHLAHQYAWRGSLQNRSSTNMLNDVPENQIRPAGSSNDQPAQEVQQVDADRASHNHRTGRVQSHEAERHHAILESMQGSQQRSQSLDTSSVSEALKSRFMFASTKCKETFTRTTRSFKERWRGRNNKTAYFRSGAQVSADVVRQALKRISPESIGKDLRVTSTSSLAESIRKPGASSQTRCATSNHLESGGVGPEITHRPSSEAVEMR